MKQSKWLAGLTCVIVGSIIDFLSFGLAPQSLLAPLAALALVWNLGMASYLLGEQYSKKDVYAAITIFIGTGICVSNAPHDEMEYDLESLIELWETNRMFYYCLTIPSVLLFHYTLITCSEDAKSVFHSVKPTQKSVSFIRMVGYCGFAGVVGGQSLLFAKSFVELIKSAFNGTDAFWHFHTYFLLFMLVVCLLVQVTYLNHALKHFDSLYVVPVYQSYWILAGVIGGLVYFGEWDAMDAANSRMFLVGIAVTFFGLYILTQKSSTHSAHNSPTRTNKSKKYSGIPEEEIELV